MCRSARSASATTFLFGITDDKVPTIMTAVEKANFLVLHAAFDAILHLVLQWYYSASYHSGIIFHKVSTMMVADMKNVNACLCMVMRISAAELDQYEGHVAAASVQAASQLLQPMARHARLRLLLCTQLLILAVASSPAARTLCIIILHSLGAAVKKAVRLA